MITSRRLDQLCPSAADDINPAAVMYFVVPPVCLIGAVIARFRPAGMARALFVTALAEAFVLAMVLLRNLPTTAWTAAVARGFGLNAFLVVLFVVSALLFLPAFLPASLKDGAASGAV